MLRWRLCASSISTGQPLDDASYCETLLEETGLLLVPGERTFGTEGADDFKEHIRVGFSVAPDKSKRALKFGVKILIARSCLVE